MLHDTPLIVILLDNYIHKLIYGTIMGGMFHESIHVKRF